LGAALGHPGEPEAQQIELLVDRLLGGQLGVGIALGGDQLAADLGGTDPGEEAVGLEPGVGLRAYASHWAVSEVLPGSTALLTHHGSGLR
jgi:hypothetical protein